MEASTVYYTDFRCPVGTSLTEKLRRLCIAAGIKSIDMDGKFVAIKMHFGELGNLAFLRPNYAKVVADLCKEQGGQPFLTDCNTLYPGSRKNALEHLSCAQENGFWPMTTGCQIIIGDGLRGTDELEVPVPNGEYCKTAKIGRAIMDADIFISLTHFKGHEATGFGGAIKNIGMGCGSRAGKMEQHSSGKPAVQEELCRGCHRCAKECGSDAIRYNENNKAVIDYEKCKGCGRCIGACNFDAIYSIDSSANEELDRKMAGAMGIVGLETAFPLLYTYLVKPGLLSFPRLMELLHDAPCRRFGLPQGEMDGPHADFTVFDLSASYPIDPADFLSQGKATPFTGWPVQARCLLTVCNGRLVWQDGDLFSKEDHT